jgi:hypothetical protein
MAMIDGRPLPDTGSAPPLRRRVVVKLSEPAAGPLGAPDAAGLDTAWVGIAQRFPGLNVRPYFPARPAGLSPLDAASAPLLDEHRYRAVDVPAGLAAEDVAAALRDTPGVEVAYPEGGPTPPPVNPDDDPRSANQGYLDPAPSGVDARWMWPSVDGSGASFVDLERGWTLDHEDLEPAQISLISGLNVDYAGHGTAVLGEVVAVDSARGGIGIAPGATARVISQWRSADDYSTADAIVNAAAAMQPGDVLLLEAQTTYPTSGSTFVPVEVEELVFDAIRAAVDRGIVVVEAAANGSLALDTFQDVRGRRVLDRSSADFRDSGAILVGAASAGVPHRRLSFSNYGSRVDCFAWGEHIDTSGDGGTGTGRADYTSTFGGTSGASPIVVGCALLIQSARRASGLPPLAPAEIRDLLSNPALNTASVDPVMDRVGVMPNLRAIAEQWWAPNAFAAAATREPEAE